MEAISMNGGRIENIRNIREKGAIKTIRTELVFDPLAIFTIYKYIIKEITVGAKN